MLNGPASHGFAASSFDDAVDGAGIGSPAIAPWLDESIDEAVLLYSLIESAKLAGVERAAYIRDTTRRAIEARGTVALPTDLLGQ